MAIQKSKTLPNGASGNYWRITSIYIDRQGLSCTGRIALFKDASTSASGAPPLGVSKVFSFPLVLSEFFNADNVISFMYEKIIARAEETLDYDINGNPIDPPRYVDPDLAEGVEV